MREVVVETADARSIVFEPPPGWLDFKPGQFLTLAVPSDLTGVAARCYSLSSTPGEGLTVTVKPWMPAHGHGTSDTTVTGNPFFMVHVSGLWQ